MRESLVTARIHETRRTETEVSSETDSRQTPKSRGSFVGTGTGYRNSDGSGTGYRNSEGADTELRLCKHEASSSPEEKRDKLSPSCHKLSQLYTRSSSPEEKRDKRSSGSSFPGNGNRISERVTAHAQHEESRNSDGVSSGSSLPSMSRIEKVLGKDMSDEPIDFRALRQDIRQLEKETIRRRQEIVRSQGDCQEIVRPNGASESWAEVKSGGLSSGGDSGLSPAPAYRSLRSLTPEDADDSFHESFEKELIRRRRRRRSASCSSRCCQAGLNILPQNR